MKKILFGTLTVLATAALAAPASAQLPIAVEPRGGVAIPVGDFGDAADNGFSYGATVSLVVAPRVSVYGGYSRAEFNLNAPAAESTDKGFEAGARLAFPGTSFSPFVKGGVLFHDFEIEQVGIEDEGEDEVGFEVGAGAAFPLGQRVSITPGVTYRQYATEFFNQGDTKISYLNVDIGLRIRL